MNEIMVRLLAVVLLISIVSFGISTILFFATDKLKYLDVMYFAGIGMATPIVYIFIYALVSYIFTGE